MSKLSKKAREDLAKRVLEVVIARMDMPMTISVPDEMLDPGRVDDDWSLFEEVESRRSEGKPSPGSDERMKSVVSGTKSITIRVPNRVLQVFHQRAEKTGVPYQTLINHVLSESAEAAK